MSAEPGGGRRRIAIVGGGFGGLAAARALRRTNVDVVVIDRMNHHLFQPLLYQVAAGVLSVGNAAAPIRAMLSRQANARVVMADVTDVDAEQRRLTLDRGEQIAYDSLIVASGAATSYFGHDEWEQHTFGLKTMADGVRLREQVFACLEEAERVSDLDEQTELQTIVVIGGGPTGVEIAGQLAVLTRHHLRRQFTRIDPARTRIVLLDAGDRVLTPFDPSLSAYAARSLEGLGVEVLAGARAEAIDAGGVTFERAGVSERIAARTVIWAAGVQAAPFAAKVAQATGAERDRGGRLHVNADSSLAGHPEISVIGDAALLPDADGRPLPGLATVAIQQARNVGEGIAAGAPGATQPFRYFDKGALAVIGRGRAVCEIRGVKLHGPPAFATYLGVHLFYLGGVPGRRVSVLTAWASMAGGREQSRVIEHELPRERVRV